MTVDEAFARELSKLNGLIAKWVTREMSRGEGIVLLSSCGFSNREIAALTGSSEGSIRGFISQARRRPGTEE